MIRLYVTKIYEKKQLKAKTRVLRLKILCIKVCKTINSLNPGLIIDLLKVKMT